MVPRDLTPRLRHLASAFPVVTLTGPRQSGKSTLCRATFPTHAFANLEEPDTRAFAADDPRGFLNQFLRSPGAIIDEIQRVPDLPSYIQPLVDQDPTPGRWILTGSQNIALLQSVSQSLAGRSAVANLLPLARSEVIRFDTHPDTLDQTILSGGYPRIFDRKLDPADWLGAYVATYLERDVRTLASVNDLATFQRFVQLCAGRTAQLLNYSDLAADTGVSQPTAKAWLSILEATFIVLRLQPWHGNLGKRLIKSPKLHFVDTGLACWLLGIRDASQLRSHPLRGPLFETWVVSEIHKHRLSRGQSTGLYFYRDTNQLEADLLIESPGRFTLIETKAGQTIASDALSGVRKVGDLLSPLGAVNRSVVFGGDSNQPRSDAAVRSWRSLHELDWTSPATSDTDRRPV
jgi:predicted AAA+ superfamily ATPase